jgi:hypothetical protein
MMKGKDDDEIYSFNISLGNAIIITPTPLDIFSSIIPFQPLLKTFTYFLPLFIFSNHWK